MQRLAKLLPPLALVGALAKVPVATTPIAPAQTDTHKEQLGNDLLAFITAAPATALAAAGQAS